MSGDGASSARACGKVILLGEHAVVFGVPAIAVGVERGAVASVTWHDFGASRLSIPSWNIEVTAEAEDHDLSRAFRAILEASCVCKTAHVVARADLPPGGGLGCSAALGVSIARALDGSASDEEIAGRAMAWERIFHGNPSGIDAAVAVGGGCILFEKGKGIERVRPKGTLTLCIGSTGRASSTKSMVEAVAKIRARRPEMVAKTFEGIASLVRNARLAIEAGDRFGLGRLMDLNQMLLSGLFVSSQEIERLCDLARSAGANGAKLTGAGGGGSVIALVAGASVAERVLDAWRKDGFEGFVTKVAGCEAGEEHVTETSP